MTAALTRTAIVQLAIERGIADLREWRAWRRYRKAYGQAQTYETFRLDQ